MSPKTKPSYYLAPHTAMLKLLEENKRHRAKAKFFLLSPKGLTAVFDFSLIGDPSEARN